MPLLDRADWVWGGDCACGHCGQGIAFVYGTPALPIELLGTPGILFFNKKRSLSVGILSIMVSYPYNKNLSLLVARTSIFSGRKLTVHDCPFTLHCKLFRHWWLKPSRSILDKFQNSCLHQSLRHKNTEKGVQIEKYRTYPLNLLMYISVRRDKNQQCVKVKTVTHTKKPPV